MAPSRRKASGPSTERRGQRQSTQPLITVAKAARKAEALVGLERWKARYPEVAVLLHEDDVLVDSMRGRSTTWTRIRVNLRNVPEAERPQDCRYDQLEVTPAYELDRVFVARDRSQPCTPASQGS